ncbi:hypothetical protein HUN61_00795 [Neoehrlichia mikurensis]|uniref:Cpg1 family polymorphic protein n=1 Tax=Neoehrlichia mikurensis TaxID=89586 RepID=UPI001C47A09F|nr:hypothetical protein [Neoehrlichia mikurensis]QXK92564.1 hypothetical protein HUN61_00795 [Neoehrlichia mikurensis]
MKETFSPLEKKVFTIIENIIKKQLNNGFFTNVFEQFFIKKPRDSHSIAIITTEKVLNILINDTYGYIPTETFYNVTEHLNYLFIEKLKSNMHYELVNLFQVLDRHVKLHATGFKLYDNQEYEKFIAENVSPVAINELARSSVEVLQGCNLCILTREWFLIRALARSIINIYVLRNPCIMQELFAEFSVYNDLATYLQQRDKILDEQLKAEKKFQEYHSIINWILDATKKAIDRFSYLPKIYAACTCVIFISRSVTVYKFDNFIKNNNLTNCTFPTGNNVCVSSNFYNYSYMDVIPFIIPRIIAILCFLTSTPLLLYAMFKNSFVRKKMCQMRYYDDLLTEPWVYALFIRMISDIVMQITIFDASNYVSNIMQWSLMRTYVPFGIIENAYKVTEICRMVLLSRLQRTYDAQFTLYMKWVVLSFSTVLSCEYASQVCNFFSYNIPRYILSVPALFTPAFAVILPYLYNRQLGKILYSPLISRYMILDMTRCLLTYTVSDELISTLPDNNYKQWLSFILSLKILLRIYVDVKCGIIVQELSNTGSIIAYMQHLRNSRILRNHSEFLRCETELQHLHVNSLPDTTFDTISLDERSNILTFNEEHYGNSEQSNDCSNIPSRLSVIYNNNSRSSVCRR